MNSNSESNGARVLVVEDNQDLAFGLSSNLELEGYQVQIAGSAKRALELAAQWHPQLIVLDVMLPDADGFFVLRQLRESDLNMPVLMLTARGEEADKVRGLRGGADDYVTKPFGLMELLARIANLLARSGPVPGISTGNESGAMHYILGDLRIELGSRQVLRGRQEITLTPMEFDLLVALLQRGGNLATRQQLMHEVWGHSGQVISRTVDTHIAELRRKIEADPTSPQLILTVRKAGYRVAREAELGGSEQ